VYKVMEEVKRALRVILRGSYTEEGVEKWFDRPRTQLDGKTPNEILKEGDLEKVIALALNLLH
jgi:hypothetical protein